MSNALLKVCFGDGLILYGQYNGTSDMCYPNLFNSSSEAWSHDQDAVALFCDRGEAALAEIVEIYSEYGAGKYWAGKACRTTMRLTDNLMGFDEGLDSLPRKRIWSDDWAKADKS